MKMAEHQMERQQRHDAIDRMAEAAHLEVMRDGLIARCHIAGLVAFHTRSLAQIRRHRNAEKLQQEKTQ